MKLWNATRRGWAHIASLEAPRVFVLMIALIACIHRALVFATHYRALHELIDQNSDFLTWQYLPVETLKNQLAKSLEYLQQTPPLPHVVLALAAKTSSWPHGVANALIILNALLSIGTVAILWRLLSDVMNRWLAFAVCLVLLLSTDLLVMEYYEFGQTIYENLAMFWLMLVVYLLRRAERRVDLASTAGVGLAVGALALTRASYAYFCFIPLLFLTRARSIDPADQRPRWIARGKRVAVYLACVASTQLLWCAKNDRIYGSFSLSTSSWQGLNLAMGLKRFAQENRQAPGEPSLESTILEHAEEYPPWFVEMIRHEGVVIWGGPYRKYVPASVLARDRRTPPQFLGDADQNSAAVGSLSAPYTRAWIRFALEHPAYLLEKLRSSYARFWQPIRSVSRYYLGPLRAGGSSLEGFELERALGEAVTERACRNELVMRGRAEAASQAPTCFYTVPMVPELFRIVNLVVIHVLGPLLALFFPIRRVLRRGDAGPRFFWLLLTVYAYAALVMNLSEHGENTRFRLSVEPVIWLLAATILTLGVREIRRAFGSRSSSAGNRDAGSTSTVS